MTGISRMQMDHSNLTGRVAVVTGGSNGIGAAVAQRLARAGASVVVGYHKGVERAEAVVASLPGAGHFAQPMVLQETRTLEEAADRAKQLLGGVDILVNAAGMTKRIPHADLGALDDTFFDQMLHVNVRGTFAAIRAFMPLLRARGDGVVVNISSISAFTGSGSNVAYCAAKAALDTMTMSLARALGPEVRFLCVSPAAVATDFIEGRSRDELERGAQTIPLRRVVEPDDVALAVLGCITHMRMATGTRFIIDAGRHLI